MDLTNGDLVKQGSQALASMEKMCSGSAMMRAAEVTKGDLLALRESSSEMKSNSLHEYAQLAGYL